MALIVERPAEPVANPERIATQRLYRTADDRVVFHGDPEAAFLLCIVGEEIPAGFDEPGKDDPEPDDESEAAELAALIS